MATNNTKSIFLANWIDNLNGNRYCYDFIATQITNKATVEKQFSGLELIFEKNKLVKIYKYEEGSKREREIKPLEKNLTYKEFEENRILQITENPNGPHQLGGELPADFQFPDNDCVVPFQYLGFIDNQDKYMNWLPFRFHLTCPIYLNLEVLFLDYSDPEKPVIIDREDLETADTSYGEDLNRTSEIVFNEMKFSFAEEEEFALLGNAGLPQWRQFPHIPTCPKSGERMKFLCQLHHGPTAKRTNVEPKEEFYRHYYEKMNFWGDGDLYVFFEPSSKIACYFIQNT